MLCNNVHSGNCVFIEFWKTSVASHWQNKGVHVKLAFARHLSFILAVWGPYCPYKFSIRIRKPNQTSCTVKTKPMDTKAPTTENFFHLKFKYSMPSVF